MGDAQTQALVSAALGVARSRCEQLNQIRAALVKGDDKKAVTLMRVYTGIDGEQDEEKGNRSSSSLD